jgi:hypothetical protein
MFEAPLFMDLLHGCEINLAENLDMHGTNLGESCRSRLHIGIKRLNSIKTECVVIRIFQG